MLDLDNITQNNNISVSNWTELITGPSGSLKTNYFLNKIQRSPEVIDKIYFDAKYLQEPKYQLLIIKREQAGINFNNAPAA